ncbi:DUF814 domain-containing protein [Bacteroidetes/Chlorobi group bacterium Naka2016]|jgi:predicted ribosome quality control (RQC) complex YloA/Tae2 family protein|nr:MAG: DUF814 domain-containing protein [Bacteroidetes/Chlorobi group bacterium Naka2016]
MRDYFTLKLLVREFQSLVGSVVVECFTQEKNSLYIQFYNGEKIETLQFSTESGLEAIFLRKVFSKARSNFKDLFPEIIGLKCNAVQLLEGERIVVFDLNGLELLFVLFGGAKTNAFLIDKEGKIIDSFLKPKEFVGKSIEIIREKKTKQEPETVGEYLLRVKYFPKEIAFYTCKKISLDCKAKLEVLPQDIMHLVDETIEQTKQKIEEASEFYVYFANHKYFISPIDLEDSTILKKFQSISEAVNFVYVQSIVYKQAKEKYKEIERQLETEYKYFKKELEDFQRTKQIESKIKEYQLFADLLISQPDLTKKGYKTIDIVDFAGRTIRIPLKPELNLRENAENYYQKIKKLKLQTATSSRKIDVIQKKFETIKLAIETLRKIENYLEIYDFEKQFADLLNQVEVFKQPKETPERFRSFEIDEGVVIYVGKNAKNNEELTFGFAKPNDYWFHARDVGGSHCVLKYSKGKEPTKEIIKKAAEIAAYYSKARNSDYVPVSYTQRKYIRKPKKAEKGTVVMMREEVVFVTPKKPEGLGTD